MSAKIAFNYDYNEQVNKEEQLDKIFIELIQAFFPPIEAYSTTYFSDIGPEQDQMIKSILNTALLHHYIKSTLSATSMAYNFKVVLSVNIYKKYGQLTPQPILLTQFQKNANFSLAKQSEELLELLMKGFLEENIKIEPVQMHRYIKGSFRLYKSQWNEALRETLIIFEETMMENSEIYNKENKTINCIHELAKMF